jgi:disulfide bond formation protein DsbB
MTTRPILLTSAAVCFVLIAIALYLQHALDLLPCPLCVIQRYLFLAVAIGCLIGAFSRRPKIGTGIGLLAALGGLGVVGEHLYVLANPGFSCGIDPVETILNRIPTATYLPWLFQADGLCENATESILGLSVPQWSAVWFVLLALTLLWLLLRRRP